MRIEYEPKAKKFNSGDIFICTDDVGEKRIFLLVDGGESPSETACSLVDLDRNTLYHTELNHVIHAVNHLNKHFVEVQHVKSDEVILKIIN